MYKGGKIIASLIIFVAFLAIPFFYNMGKANAGPEITPQQLAYMQSIEPAINMKADHPQLFNQWRNAVVRDGKTIYVNSQGKAIDMSIENIAASDPSHQLCVTCHNYVAVKLTCISCHSGIEGGATQ